MIARCAAPALKACRSPPSERVPSAKTSTEMRASRNSFSARARLRTAARASFRSTGMWPPRRRWPPMIGTRINENRAKEAVATGATTVATACPFCMVMMSDGLAEADGGAAVKAMDISEVLAARLASVPEERRLPVV